VYVQVKPTEIQTEERKRKSLSLSMLVEKQEVKHGLTQEKLFAPYISYSRLLTADPVLTWVSKHPHCSEE